MNAKIRSVEPRADAADVAGEMPAESPVDAVAWPPVGSAAAHSRRRVGPAAADSRRPVDAAGLGPNGDVVLDLLERAARLTPTECDRLEEAAGWRWWPVTPLPGTSVTGARATALVRGRAAGRSEALAGLESAVRTVVAGHPIAATRGSGIAACISNAGLAVAVRDVIDSETFETLFGPWREVMHH